MLTVFSQFTLQFQALIWIILLIVGAIVLLGLFILLAWKCWTIYAVSSCKLLRVVVNSQAIGIRGVTSSYHSLLLQLHVKLP